MYHHYDPTETTLEYVHRKERADRDFARIVERDKAARRKRVKRVRNRSKVREAYRFPRG